MNDHTHINDYKSDIYVPYAVSQSVNSDGCYGYMEAF